MFSAAGQGNSDALLSTVIVGAVNIGATLILMGVIDRVGRRFIFIAGGVLMFMALVLIGPLLDYNTRNPGNVNVAACIVAFICIFVAAFQWGGAPLTFTLPSELHAAETRSAGCSICFFLIFFFNFVMSQSFLSMLCSMKWEVFLFFAGVVALLTLLIIFFIPETKGVPAEKTIGLLRLHWFWSKVVGVEPLAEPTTHTTVHMEDDSAAGVRVNSVKVDLDTAV